MGTGHGAGRREEDLMRGGRRGGVGAGWAFRCSRRKVKRHTFKPMHGEELECQTHLDDHEVAAKFTHLN